MEWIDLWSIIEFSRLHSARLNGEHWCSRALANHEYGHWSECWQQTIIKHCSVGEQPSTHDKYAAYSAKKEIPDQILLLISPFRILVGLWRGSTLWTVSRWNETGVRPMWKRHCPQCCGRRTNAHPPNHQMTRHRHQFECQHARRDRIAPLQRHHHQHIYLVTCLAKQVQPQRIVTCTQNRYDTVSCRIIFNFCPNRRTADNCHRMRVLRKSRRAI